MPIEKCPKCGEEYDPRYSEHECQEGEKQLGFNWGYVWIGLGAFNGFMATIGVVTFLIFLFLPQIKIPFIFIWMAILVILIIFPIAQIIGLLRQKKWALGLVYVELSLGVLGIIIGLIMQTRSFISTAIGLIIIFLWFRYFDRRSTWFNGSKEKNLFLPPDTFPSSWNLKDNLLVASLVLLLPIGLILLWTIGRWPKMAKIIITIISLAPFIVISILALWVTLRLGALSM